MKSIPPALAAELESAAMRVVEDYGAFITRGPAPGTHDDPKAFAAHHAAAKSALAHLEHLMKIARAAGAGGDALAEGATLLQQVRGEMRDEPQEEAEDDSAAP